MLPGKATVDMPTLSIRTGATKEQLYSLLTDYVRYVEWTPDVTEVTLLAYEGDIAVVEFCSPELMPETYQLEFVQTKPTTITFKQNGLYQETGQWNRGVYGRWHLADASDGHGVIVTGTLCRETTFWQQRRNRRQSHLILQRRLDVMAQLFPSTEATPKPGLTALHDQMVRHHAAMITGLPTAALAVRFHGSSCCFQEVDRT
jgi:hypothetical protein